MMRTFAFLSCVDCRHFRPKRMVPREMPWGGALLSSVYVGLCTAAGSPEWVVWRGLDSAVAGAATCPDREPRPAARPRCDLYDRTAESGADAYPQRCVYFKSSSCPLCR